MYAQELTRHYADVRRRLSSPRTVERLAPLPVTFRYGSQTIVSAARVSWGRYEGPTLSNIIGAVCKYYNVDRSDLVSPRRTQKIVIPRHVVMYLARKLTTQSLPQIGHKLGDRDHTTIIYGIEKIERLLPLDESLRDAVSFLTKTIEGRE